LRGKRQRKYKSNFVRRRKKEPIRKQCILKRAKLKKFNEVQ